MLKNIITALILAVFAAAAVCGCAKSASNNRDGTPCGDGLFCKSDELCYNGECVKSNVIPCRIDDDCPLKSTCKNRVCVDLSSDGDADPDRISIKESDELAETNGGETADYDNIYGALCKPCEKDEQCNGGKNLCMTGSTGGKFCGFFCKEDGDCPLNYKCKPYLTVKQCAPESGFCGETCVEKGCADGQKCNAATGLCELDVGLKLYCETCANNYDCASGGLCMPDQTGTNYCGRDCSATRACVEVNSYCKQLSDTAFQCWPISNNCGGGGDTHNCEGVQCKARMVCVEDSGKCEYQGNHCHITGCPAGSACSEETGKCESPPWHCLVTGCDPGFLCNPQTGICEIINNDGDADAFDSFDNRDPDDYPAEQIDDQPSTYCKQCAAQSDCGPGGACVSNAVTFDHFCAPPCSSHADCPPGSACRSDLGWNTCIPNSSTCRKSVIGGGCPGGAADCDSLTCILEFDYPNVVWPDGYCTKVCDLNNPETSCPANSYCFQIEYNYGAVANLCMKVCSLYDSSTCRGNYVCFDVGFGDGRGLCITALYPF